MYEKILNLFATTKTPTKRTMYGTDTGFEKLYKHIQARCKWLDIPN